MALVSCICTNPSDINLTVIAKIAELTQHSQWFLLREKLRTLLEFLRHPCLFRDAQIVDLFLFEKLYGNGVRLVFTIGASTSQET